jgi:hypothetical protein
MNDEKFMTVMYNSKLKTISVMDEFEKRSDMGDHIYDSLILRNVFKIIIDDNIYSVSLIIAKKSPETECDDEKLTFTQLKREVAGKTYGTGSPVPMIAVRVLSALRNQNPAEYIIFQRPVLFHAQTSFDRTGYGSVQCGHILIRQGTLYGATTSYVITGVKLDQEA